MTVVAARADDAALTEHTQRLAILQEQAAALIAGIAEQQAARGHIEAALTSDFTLTGSRRADAEAELSRLGAAIPQQERELATFNAAIRREEQSGLALRRGIDAQRRQEAHQAAMEVFHRMRPVSPGGCGTEHRVPATTQSSWQ